MEDPWQKVNEKVKNTYNANWPHLLPNNPSKQELAKKNDLDKEFRVGINDFLKKKAEKSISYRLFMIFMINAIKTEDNSPLKENNTQTAKKKRKYSKLKKVT